MRICKGCKEAKPIAEYYECDGNLDGLFGKCKRCFIAQVVAARKIRENKKPRRWATG